MLPEELKKGDRLAAGWLNRLVRAVVARTVNAGPGLLKTQTPAGTTLSLAPQRRGAAGGAAADFDFAWKATLAPVLGSGGVPTGSATVSFRLPLLFDMVGGQTNFARLSSITVSDSARICARVRTVTSSGGIAMSATLHAAPVSGTDPSPPADGETDYPVAQANRSGDAQSGYSWRLTQLQLGAIHVLHLVDEEV